MTHDPVTAVFVRNIPQSADEASIEAAFAKIGPVAVRDHSNGEEIAGCHRRRRRRRAGRYAFVQFEKAESAQAAIEATVEMDGRALSVEEKREGGHNNRNRGAGRAGAKRREGQPRRRQARGRQRRGR